VTSVTPLPTPNPNALKFQLDRPATDGKAETFREGSDPSGSPLGHAIFSLGGISNVFLTADFVSVTVDSASDWDTLIPKVTETIEKHFAS